MSILVVWSSPNRDGLTAAAKDRLMEGIHLAGGEAVDVCLNGLKLEHCRACGDGWGPCRTEGRCVIPDDFAELYGRLTAADAIAWVTAVYWHDLTECMKAFTDRLRRCETKHNHSLSGKKCLLAACAGGTGNGAIQCLDRLETTLKHMGMAAVDRLPVIQFNRGYMLSALQEAGKALAKSVTA